jgi:hypothetical protein
MMSRAGNTPERQIAPVDAELAEAMRPIDAEKICHRLRAQGFAKPRRTDRNRPQDGSKP